MKISNSIPVLLFLTGMMCLFFSSCNEEESERGTLVPLRLSMTIPSAEGNVTTRAAETGKFNIALSTSSGYANNAKTYITSSIGTSSAALTSTDPLKISRLLTTTPLTLYGTYNYSNLGNQPVFYSGNATVAEGAVSVEPQWGNAIIVVKANNKERYQVNIKSLYSPAIKNGQYIWNTTGNIPTLTSSGAKPATFETTDITQPDALFNADGHYASVVPGSVEKGNNIMSITEWDGKQQGDTYQVTTPSAITFEANKCYFITLNVNAEKEVTMTVNITPMTIETITLRAKPGIYDLQDLKDFRDAWNSNGGSTSINGNAYDKWMDKTTNTVNLYADIDLNKEEWTSIRIWQNVTFNGNNHTLSNLKQTSDYGLFYAITNATVKNLTIQGATVSYPKGDCSVMALLINNNGIISNCHIKNANLTGANSSGFVSNLQEGGKIEGCSISNSSITGTNLAAGIAAKSVNAPVNAKITACTVSGCSIDGEAENSGIIGTQTTGLGATITACTVSNTKLGKTTKYSAIADGKSNKINGCYFANLTADVTKIDSGDGYLVTPTDLETDYINNKLNNTIYNKDSSFPFKYESGKIVKGSPSETTSFPKGIYTATHLADCGKNPGNYAESDIINLYDDIDMQDVSYTPMGSSSSPADYSFKGNSHKISNLNAAGLYGEASLKKAMSIENLIMVNPTFSDATADGCGLVAFSSYNPLTFTNCQILGGSSNGTADGCAGGLVGGSISGDLIINNCLVSGMSKIEAPYAGGFIGLSNGKTTISRSAVRNIGLLKGGYIGSFVGREMGSGSEYKFCIAEKIKGEASDCFGFAAGSYLENMTLTGILYYNVPNATDGENAEAYLTKNNCEEVNYGFGESHATVLNKADTDGKWSYDYGTSLLTQDNWEKGY